MITEAAIERWLEVDPEGLKRWLTVAKTAMALLPAGHGRELDPPVMKALFPVLARHDSEWLRAQIDGLDPKTAGPRALASLLRETAKSDPHKPGHYSPKCGQGIHPAREFRGGGIGENADGVLPIPRHSRPIRRLSKRPHSIRHGEGRRPGCRESFAWPPADRSLPALQSRYDSWNALTNNLVYADPAAAVEWVGQIGDPNIRSKAAQRIFDTWTWENPAGAREWLLSLDYVDAARKELILQNQR